MRPDRLPVGLPVDPADDDVDLAALERAVLERWRREDLAGRAPAAADAPVFTCDVRPCAGDAPDQAALADRVLADVLLRHRGMRGQRTQGPAALPGGLAERLALRADGALVGDTADPAYVDSVWWSLARLWDDGALVEADRPVAWCPACATERADATAHGHRVVEAPAAYVRFPVTGHGALRTTGASLLVWTAAPWTLLANAAVTIDPGTGYVLAQAAGDDYPVVIAGDRAPAVLGDHARILRAVDPAELLGLIYRPPVRVAVPGPARVIAGPRPPDGEGTGLGHVAPGVGVGGLATARAHALPVVDPLDERCILGDRAGPYTGMSPADADAAVLADLEARGLLLRAGAVTRRRPTCPECATPLLHRAVRSWCLRPEPHRRERGGHTGAGDPGTGTASRDHDARPQSQRAVSRRGSWGTPLPLWRCPACDAVTAVASRAELSRVSGVDRAAIDPRRPFIDDVTFPCPACGHGEAARVPDVVERWYEDAAAPFAQFGFPHDTAGAARFEARGPADVAIDTDGTGAWPAAVDALSAALFDRPAHRAVVLRAGERQGAGPARGDVPSVVDRHGADALRWALLTGHARDLDVRRRAAAAERMLQAVWRVHRWFAGTIAPDGWAPVDALRAPVPARRDRLDRWVLAELASAVAAVDRHLDHHDVAAAAVCLDRFVADLSGWYAPRAAQRLRCGRSTATERDRERRCVGATLHECLVTLAALLAPLTPLLSDELYQRLVRGIEPQAPVSVHHLRFPTADADADDGGLRAAVAGARRIIALGRRARDDAGIAPTQPLRAAWITLPARLRDRWPDVAAVLAGELHVEQMHLVDPGAAAVDGAPRAPEAGVGVAVTDGDHHLLLDPTVDDTLRREGLARAIVRCIQDLREHHAVAAGQQITLRIDAVSEVAGAVEDHLEAIAAEVRASRIELGPMAGGDEVDVGTHPTRIMVRRVAPRW